MAKPRHPGYAYRKANWTTYQDPELRKGRMGRPYRRWRDKVLAAAVPMCCRCGGPIDKSLPWRHPMSATADHLVPLTRGGAPLDLRNGAPAHRRCNLSHGNRVGGVVAPEVRPTADRRW